MSSDGADGGVPCAARSMVGSEVATLGELAARVADRDAALRVTGLRGAAPAAVVAQLVRAHGTRPALVLVPSSKAADAFADDLRGLLGEPARGGRVRSFPRHDSQPYERFSPQPFVVAQRMDVLYRWLASARPGESGDEPAPVVVAPWTALAARVPSREAVRARTVHLEIGQRIDRDALVATLVGAGYGRMPLVEERGELAVRGGILDVFPPQRERPLRVELLGDEVESIREFDPASQRSEGALPHAVAPPPRELLLDRSLVIERSAELRALAAEQGVAARSIDEFIDALLRGHLPPGAESLAPLLQPALESVFEFLPADALVAVDDPAAGCERLRRYAEEALENHELARASGRPASPPDELLLDPDGLAQCVRARRPVYLERLDVADEADGVARLQLRTRANDELRGALERARKGDAALLPLVEQLDAWRAKRWRVVLTAASLSGVERLRTLVGEYGLRVRAGDAVRPVWRWSGPGRVEVRAVPLSAGFQVPGEGLAVVTEDEVFGPREKRRARKRWPEGPAVEAIEKIAPGDYLVHVDHGIGIYRGLVELGMRGVAGEFLRLEYEGGDRLFLPVDRLNRVQVYAGSEGPAPRIDRLGGGTWERARRKVARSLRRMAQALLSVHAARELAPGFAFSPRDRAFEEFEAAFPFDETPDQHAAIEEVLEDMESGRPMDRLVCGDVGYGKTEVAIRAAFRAAMDGRQVAVLVPTTILCQQHEETFRERLRGYPIEIGTLSRFTRPKQARELLEALVAGTVEVVIGTHRLLHPAVRFRDLGLLVVDEEHRFGVAHKERIKQLKKNVDVLTLTATPIPRTLQLALTGIRNLSVIETPPADRLAIRTQVCRFSEDLVREVILRELRRGGQVYYVHNRVRSIGGVAEMLARVVPEVRVIVAHGQMRERELEERVLDFAHGGADVLLCTTIIESGIDIPRANTILIDRADRLGLAQLYQLRGRVGRSNRRAYAYLAVPGPLSGNAERRLEALQDFSELGSGFRLASMDLEIRGAGDLLGPDQSGNVAEVGYETYMEMLEETVAELRGEPQRVEIDPEIRLPIAARLPESFVSAVNQRLVLYKRLASCRDDAEVDRIRDEILDRYGSMPPEAENLLLVIRLKIQARRLGVAAVDFAAGELVLTAGAATNIHPKRLVGMLTRASGGVRVTPGHKIYASVPDASPSALYARARQLFENLAAPD